jgi:hypothetical protein
MRRLGMVVITNKADAIKRIMATETRPIKSAELMALRKSDEEAYNEIADECWKQCKDLGLR